MNGFGKMFLLAFVSMACLTPHTTADKTDVDSLEDLMELVSESLGHQELTALVPRGLDMINQMVEAAQDFSKRDNSMLSAFLPALMGMMNSQSNGNAMLNPKTFSPLVKMGLKEILGNETYPKIEKFIEPIVSVICQVLKVVLSVASKEAAPTASAPAATAPAATDAPAVGPRDAMQDIYDLIQEAIVH